MKILVGNVHFSPNSFGGATVVVEETVRRLHQQGHEVVVFTATSDSHLKPHELHRYQQWGIPVVAIRPNRFVTEETTYSDPAVDARFESLLNTVRPDVVHLHAIQQLGVGIAETAQRLGIPTVVTLHDAWWLCQRQFMIRETGRHCGQDAIRAAVCATCVPDPAWHAARQQRSLRVLNACAKVLTPSRFWREAIVSSGLRPDVVKVNHNGVSRPRAGWTRPIRSGPARLGYVGGVGATKGSDHLVKALQNLRRTDYELVVVDNARNLGLVGTTADDWPVPGAVTIVPAYSPETIDDYFGGIDALVSPSQALETYGLTVREAALRGVWPILPDGGGPAEHIVSGRNGTIYPRAGGVEALTGAIDDYLVNFRNLTPDPGVNRRIPSYDDQVDDLIILYESVVGRS